MSSSFPKTPSGTIDINKDIFVQRWSIYAKDEGTHGTLFNQLNEPSYGISLWCGLMVPYWFLLWFPGKKIECRIPKLGFPYLHLNPWESLWILFITFYPLLNRINQTYYLIYWFSAEFPFLGNLLCSSQFHLFAVIFPAFKSFLTRIRSALKNIWICGIF